MIGHPLLERVPVGADSLPAGWPQDYGIPTGGPQVLAWAEVHLVQPDGPHAGDGWSFTEAQGRFVSWWFAVDDTGRFLWRRCQLCLPKGSGKSPLAAALACVEFAGPCRFSHFDAEGEPVLIPHPNPDVKLSALSESQATDATMSLAGRMLGSRAAERAVDGLDVGLTRIRSRRGLMTPATARAASKQGSRHTAVILDETHEWTRSNRGLDLAKVLRGNLAKTDGRSVETTNLWVVGGGSVAEDTFEAAEAVASGAQRGDGVLRWHPTVECDDLADEDQLRAALGRLYADAPWVNVDRLVLEIHDRGTDPQFARRFYLNQASASDDAWLRPDQWEACRRHADDDPVAAGDVVVLGFDGSRGRKAGHADATALIGCRVRDGRLFEVGVWQAREGEDDWTAPEGLIDSALRDAFGRYRVVGMYADPSLWEVALTRWEQDLTRHVRFKVRASADHPMSWWVTTAGRWSRALEAFQEAVWNGDVAHGGEFRLSEHVLNARLRPKPGSGLLIGKEHDLSLNKIDAAVAAVLAWKCRMDALAQGVTGKARGRGRILVLPD